MAVSELSSCLLNLRLSRNQGLEVEAPFPELTHKKVGNPLLGQVEDGYRTRIDRSRAHLTDFREEGKQIRQ